MSEDMRLKALRGEVYYTPPRRSPMWNYLLKEFEQRMFAEDIEVLDLEGWELVSETTNTVSSSTIRFFYVFRRKVVTVNERVTLP